MSTPNILDISKPGSNIIYCLNTFCKRETFAALNYKIHQSLSYSLNENFDSHKVFDVLSRIKAF